MNDTSSMFEQTDRVTNEDKKEEEGNVYKDGSNERGRIRPHTLCDILSVIYLRMIDSR